MEKIFRTEIAGRPLVVETGKIAQFANGSALVRYAVCKRFRSRKIR